MSRHKYFLSIPALISLTAPVLAQAGDLFGGIQLQGFIGEAITLIGVNTFNYIISFLFGFALTTGLLGALPFMAKVDEKARRSTSALISAAVGISVAVYVFVNQVDFIGLLTTFFFAAMLTFLALIAITFFKEKNDADKGKIKWEAIGVLLMVVGIGLMAIFRSALGALLLFVGGIIMLILGFGAIGRDARIRYKNFAGGRGKSVEEGLEAAEKKLTTKDLNFIKGMEELDANILKEDNNIEQAIKSFTELLQRAEQTLAPYLNAGRVNLRPLEGGSYREVVRRIAAEIKVIEERIGAIGEEEALIYTGVSKELKALKQIWNDLLEEGKLWRIDGEAQEGLELLAKKDNMFDKRNKILKKEESITQQIATHGKEIQKLSQDAKEILSRAVKALNAGIRSAVRTGPTDLAKAIEAAKLELREVGEITERERHLLQELETITNWLNQLEVAEITIWLRNVRKKNNWSITSPEIHSAH